MFVGIEQEGRWRGLLTVFATRAEFSDEVAREALLEEAEQCGADHLYLGARGDLLRAEDVGGKVWSMIEDGFVVTVEVDHRDLERVEAWALSEPRLRVLARIDSPLGDLPVAPSVEVKVQGARALRIAHLEAPVEIGYAGDREVQR